jgi:hypothetical protein
MPFCSTLEWVFLAPIFKSLLPGLDTILYPIIGYLVILVVLFVLSKLTKMPLIGVFVSFFGDVLIKIWLSIGIILLIISIFCIL